MWLASKLYIGIYVYSMALYTAQLYTVVSILAFHLLHYNTAAEEGSQFRGEGYLADKKNFLW